MRSVLPLLFCIAACGQFPALDGRISDAARTAPYPTLTPLDELLAKQAPTPSADADMAARIATLQARAERLRQVDIAALQ